MKRVRYIIGVDEVGRGPIAGPVTVAAVVVPADFEFGAERPFDSKKLSAAKREEWFLYAKDHPAISFATSSVSPRVIDRIGINEATLLAVERSLGRITSNFGLGNSVEVLLDGLLRAPEGYRQKTIIKGDEKVPAISLASIVAKVTRDRHMVRAARKFPNYGFERHKGYGTKEHYQKIAKYGISEIHRKRFLGGVHFEG